MPFLLIDRFLTYIALNVSQVFESGACPSADEVHRFLALLDIFPEAMTLVAY